MPTIDIKDWNNKTVGSVELPEEIFAYPYKEHLVHEAVRNYLASLRQGTHKTKTRSEVAGSGKKPFRQKGTGRARQGTRSAPHYAGGGVVFGPTPRSFEKRLPKRMKRSALVGALTSKFDYGAIKVVSDLAMEAPRTRQLVGHLEALHVSGRILLVEDIKNERLELSARNLPGVAVIRSDSLNIVDVLAADAIVITAPSIATMSEVYA